MRVTIPLCFNSHNLLKAVSSGLDALKKPFVHMGPHSKTELGLCHNPNLYLVMCFWVARAFIERGCKPYP